MDQINNPYAPTTIPSDRPLVVPGETASWSGLLTASLFTASLMIGAIVSSTIAFINVESIVVSGPIMFILAGIQTFLCIRRMRTLSFSGIAVMLFVVACLVTILLNRWSPTQAQRPVSLAIGIFSLLLNTQWVALWYQLTMRRDHARVPPSRIEAIDQSVNEHAFTQQP